MRFRTREGHAFRRVLLVVLAGLLLGPALVAPLGSAQVPPVPQPPTYSGTLEEHFNADVTVGPPPGRVGRLTTVAVPLVIQDISNVSVRDAYPQGIYMFCEAAPLEGQDLAPAGWSVATFPEPPCGVIRWHERFETSILVDGGALGPFPETLQVGVRITFSQTTVGFSRVYEQNFSVQAEPVVLFDVQPAGVPDPVSPDEIFRVPFRLNNGGNQVSIFTGVGTGPPGWVVSAPLSIAVEPRQSVVFDVMVQSPQQTFILSRSELISISYWEISNPAVKFTISTPVQVQGIYWDPAWIAFLLIAGVLLVFLTVILAVAKRTIEEQVLGKPAKPWRIAVEAEYLARLKERDPEEWYIVRHYLMVEEYHSALLWYHHYKRATRKDRRLERKWLKDNRGVEKGVAVLAKAETRLGKRWDRKIRRTERKGDRKIRKLERKLDRRHRKEQGKLDRRYDSIVAKIEKRHARRLEKAQAAHGKELAGERKRVARENKARARAGQEPLLEPQVAPPVIPDPELPSREEREPPKLEASRYAKRAERIRRRFQTKVAKLQARKERELAKRRAANEVRRAKLEGSLPAHPHTHLDEARQFIPEEEAVVEKDTSVIRRILRLPTLEEREERKRFKARVLWETEALVAQGLDPKQVMRERAVAQKRRHEEERRARKEQSARDKADSARRKREEAEAVRKAKFETRQAHRSAEAQAKALAKEQGRAANLQARDSHLAEAAAAKAAKDEEREATDREREAARGAKEEALQARPELAPTAPVEAPPEAASAPKKGLGTLIGFARSRRRKGEPEPSPQGPAEEPAEAQASAPEGPPEPSATPEEPRPSFLSGWRSRMAERRKGQEEAVAGLPALERAEASPTTPAESAPELPPLDAGTGDEVTAEPAGEPRVLPAAPRTPEERAEARRAANDARLRQKAAAKVAKVEEKRRRRDAKVAAREAGHVAKLRAREEKARAEYSEAAREALEAAEVGPAKVPFSVRARGRAAPEAEPATPEPEPRPAAEEPGPPKAMARARAAVERERQAARRESEAAAERARKAEGKERRRRDKALAKARSRMERMRSRLERDHRRAERAAAKAGARAAPREEPVEEPAAPTPVVPRPAPPVPEPRDLGRLREAHEGRLAGLRIRGERQRERAVKGSARAKIVEEAELAKARRAEESPLAAEAPPMTVHVATDERALERLREKRERELAAHRARVAKVRGAKERKAAKERARAQKAAKRAAQGTSAPAEPIEETERRAKAALGGEGDDWDEERAGRSKRLSRLRERARR